MGEQNIAGHFVVGDGLQQGVVIEPGMVVSGEPGPEIVTIPAGAQVYPRTFDTRRHKRVRLIDDDGTVWSGVLYAVESDTDGRVPAVGICWACKHPGGRVEMEWHGHHLIHARDECRALAAQLPETREHRG